MLSTDKIELVESCDEQSEVPISGASTMDLLEVLREIVHDELAPYLGHEDEQERALNIIDELVNRAVRRRR